MVKAVVMDLDGTLLTSDKIVSIPTKEKLNWLAEKKGVTLVLASGRTKSRMKDAAEAIQLEQHNGMLIESNGVALYNYKDDSHKIIRKMHDEELAEIVRALQKYHCEILIMGDEDVFIMLPEGVKESYYITQNSNMEGMRNREFFFIDSIDQVTQKVNKICVYNRSDKIEALLETLKDETFQYDYWMGRASPEWLEIMPDGVSKGHALQKLMEINNWNEDEVVVFGDGENDLSMLKVVTYSVAMDNAMDIVKDVANYTTASNDSDGIVEFFNDKEEELL
ncbi:MULTISPECIES: HAD family hydrolase [unclassified Breznakia]|uniref:HAD family hydrolase n=1 Tax=unclassified Breznakia TaxID=2623764 RepID=UPI002476118A|nr:MULTISPECIES: HAD family hydrolase [unclassified Breznakia]MDH6368126.1 Cof subfamily protein (haloacid dehalogenase superfamily) [Breznakia sp. PH1-1]MDH6405215.1 Cof subfamily protein (haloacid dehalogenase superfamily) [Breznakia sp. PF1-11]MDH6412932.1 Cof subfamily protein (haloacid dehalogenase superfamily) [Breznakia sp. PFB1-11]MDH6415294.1 Cof subfamily protein (haloacid dehalogenase superfamily) [Breznakia sp. PFB1-14]MDH6417600.1 Cof subfamily protein (haloacid dehalogenase super